MSTLRNFIGLLLFSWCAVGCSSAVYSTNRSNELLTDADRSVGSIMIGSTSIKETGRLYGGEIRKEKGADGTFASLCLVVEGDGGRILLNLLSGALGAWDIVTEIHVMAVSADYEDKSCGLLVTSDIESLWIGKNIKDVINRFGPTARKDGVFEYNSTNERVSKYGEQYSVYSGIMFKIGKHNEVYAYEVFEVESD